MKTNETRSLEPVFVDFETFFDQKNRYSLTNLSDIQYISDPRFQILSVAISSGGPIRVMPGDDKDWPAELTRLASEGRTFCAHNARFDFRIATLRYGIKPVRIVDTMLMARYLGFPNCKLGVLSQSLLGETKQDLATDGKRLHELSRDEWKALAKYNAHDVHLTAKLYQKFVPLLPPIELGLIDQTIRLCLEGIRVDFNLINQLRSDHRQEIERTRTLDAELFEKRNQPIKVRQVICSRFGTDPGSVDKKKLDTRVIPQGAKALLEKLWSIKEVEREAASLASLTDRMIVPGKDVAFLDLNYSKAVTHRWSSGSDGSRSFNIQNMGRDSQIRGVLCPRAGHRFLIVDLSQIEVRVAAWIAGEKELLEAFGVGKCVYCDFGRHIFGHVLDATKEGNERSIAKQAVLGLQYGMGATKFLSVLATQCPSEMKKSMTVLGIPSEDEFAKMIVAAYRRAYPRLARFPKMTSDTLVGRVTSNGRTGPVVLGDLGSFRMEYNADDCLLLVTLPTGGRIFYRNISVSLEPSRFSKYRSEYAVCFATAEGPRTFSFSAPFENVVQATARDVLGVLLLRSEREGLVPRMHTHDEVVFEAPESTAMADLERINRIFSDPLTVCPGLPLACKAFSSDRYTKG